MKKIVPYFIIICISFFAGCSGRKQIPVLNETYSRIDKKPFGAYIAYRNLSSFYYFNNIRDKKQSFDKTWNSITDTASLYICITPQLLLNEKEINAMMQYVYTGNDLFISAKNIDEGLLKRLKCDVKPSFLLAGDLYYFMKETSIKSSSVFSYYYLPFVSYFSNMNAEATRIIGWNERNQPNAIVYFHGKGKIFLHCDPRAFSNYFLLKNNNYRYIQEIFRYTSNQPEKIYWDDYYRKLSQRRKSNKQEDDKSFSSLSEIKKHPPLWYALWLSLLLLLLYILFGGKRMQRIVEQIPPNENTTVAFTETIGRLYLQKKDNKNIAEKMITYFNEHIRNVYFLNTNTINNEFIHTLSRKSGVAHANVHALYQAIIQAHNSVGIEDEQLLFLHTQIQQFYKTRTDGR